MTAKLVGVISAALFAGMIAAHAQSPAFAIERITDLSPAKCESMTVLGILYGESLERNALIAEQGMPIIEELAKISAKAPAKEKPLKDQLNAADIGRFTSLNQRLMTTRLASMIESRRQRDVGVIGRMIILVDREYRWNDVPKEGTEDHIISAILQLLRFLEIKLSEPNPKSTPCSLEFALQRLKEEPLNKLIEIEPQAKSAMTTIAALQKKYGTEKLDRSKMSKADADRLEYLNVNVIGPFQRHIAFINDIKTIQLMARTSDLLYAANMQDVTFSGGDINHIGDTIERNKSKNIYDEATQMAIGVWSMINEKLPSDTVKFWEKVKERFDAENANKGKSKK